MRQHTISHTGYINNYCITGIYFLLKRTVCLEDAPYNMELHGKELDKRTAQLVHVYVPRVPSSAFAMTHTHSDIGLHHSLGGLSQSDVGLQQRSRGRADVAGNGIARTRMYVHTYPHRRTAVRADARHEALKAEQRHATCTTDPRAG